MRISGGVGSSVFCTLCIYYIYSFIYIIYIYQRLNPSDKCNGTYTYYTYPPTPPPGMDFLEMSKIINGSKVPLHSCSGWPV